MSDAVIVHLASAVRPGIDVVFLDTGYHFPETIGTRDAVAAVYPVNLVNVTPSRTVAEQDAELGPRLYGRNPDLCCYLRKVEPLERTLKRYDSWITGVRREETLSRRTTRVVEFDEKRQKVKVNPIVAWTSEQVDEYIASNGVLVNPLVYDGYPSIGCRTCTLRVEPGADPRVRPVGRDGQDRVRHPRLSEPARRSIATSGAVTPASPRDPPGRSCRGRARVEGPTCRGHGARPASGRRPGQGAGLDVRAAFLDHCAPSLPQVLGSLAPPRRA